VSLTLVGPAAAVASTQAPAAAAVATPAPAGASGGPASPLPTGLAAHAWLVADAGSGAVLAASGLHNRDMPASTMKILTALTVLPGLAPDRIVTVGENTARVDGTKVGLVPGLGYSVRDLATAMMIASGNDATMALVDAAGGATDVLGRMNALAATLGAHDTVAGDPTGLDSPGQLTSVYDLAVFGRAAINDPSVRGYLTIPRASLPGRGDQRFEIQNHNLLLGRYEGTVGVKNGYTVAAGATYVGAATRGGHTLIVALLRTAPLFDADARALLDWGFANDGRVTPVAYLPRADGQAVDDTASPATASRPTTGAAAATGHGSRRTGLLASVGPTTWIALTLTAVAFLGTLLMHTQRRRRRASAALAAVSTGPIVHPMGAVAARIDGRSRPAGASRKDRLTISSASPRRGRTRDSASQAVWGAREVRAPQRDLPTRPIRRAPAVEARGPTGRPPTRHRRGEEHRAPGPEFDGYGEFGGYDEDDRYDRYDRYDEDDRYDRYDRYDEDDHRLDAPGFARHEPNTLDTGHGRRLVREQRTGRRRPLGGQASGSEPSRSRRSEDAGYAPAFADEVGTDAFPARRRGGAGLDDPVFDDPEFDEARSAGAEFDDDEFDDDGFGGPSRR